MNFIQISYKLSVIYVVVSLIRRTYIGTRYLPTAVLPTRVVTKINGHRDKWSSKFSNLNNVNNKIAQTK